MINIIISIFYTLKLIALFIFYIILSIHKMFFYIIIIIMSLIIIANSSSVCVLFIKFEKVIGVVTESYTYDGNCARGATCTHARVIYEYKINGQVYNSKKTRVEGVFFTKSPNDEIKEYSAGKVVSVYYDVKNPSFALLEHPRRTLLTYYSLIEFLTALTYTTTNVYILIKKLTKK